MGRASLSAAAVIVLWGCLVFTPRGAFAQSELDEADRLFEEANFEAALGALEVAERGTGLERDDVVRLLLLRALIHHALGDQERLDTALRELAVIEPTYVMDTAFPPAVRGRFEVIRSRDTEPLALEVETSTVTGGLEITARVLGDSEGLVREVHIFTRIGDGEWLQTESNTARIPLARGSVLDYYVHAIGPGGALLLAEGSESEPRQVGEEAEAGPGSSTESPGDPSTLEGSLQTTTTSRRRISPWVWVGAGAGVVVVTAIVLGAVLGTRQEDTSVGPLEIDWP